VSLVPLCAECAHGVFARVASITYGEYCRAQAWLS
jgi:hypothetical protein